MLPSAGSVATCGDCRFGTSPPGSHPDGCVGFFETDQEHAAVLQEAARVLEPGGRFVLKVANGAPILEAFRSTEREERDGVVIDVANTLTADPPRLTQRISVSGPRGRGEYQRRQRLYRLEDLLAAHERAGFRSACVVAAPDRATFDPATSPAMWLLAERRRHGPLNLADLERTTERGFPRISNATRNADFADP